MEFEEGNRKMRVRMVFILMGWREQVTCPRSQKASGQDSNWGLLGSETHRGSCHCRRRSPQTAGNREGFVQGTGGAAGPRGGARRSPSGKHKERKHKQNQNKEIK